MKKECRIGMNADFVSSTKNPHIKQLLALQQKSAERRRTGLFVVEGRRELEHCLEAGFEVVELYTCPEVMQGELPEALSLASCDDLRSKSVRPTVFTIPSTLYERIAYRGTTEGIMAVVQSRHRSLNELQLPENPLIIVLESVEKPGNLGAILRSADAAGADAVCICDPLTDLYNPNLIRASMGAVFTVPCVACTSEECIAFLQLHNIQILTAQLQDSSPYYDINMKGATAIVMGTESTGLTGLWRQAATAHIRIPMLGRLDSLNVSVSSAILLYEAVRQREGE